METYVAATGGHEITHNIVHVRSRIRLGRIVNKLTFELGDFVLNQDEVLP